MNYAPGQELDELVLRAVFGRRSIGDGICVPYGPEGEPLGWAVVAPASGAMQPGGEIMRVYVRKCDCPHKSYVEGVRDDEDRIGGHGLGCLDPVPRFSLEEPAALALLRRFNKLDLSKDIEDGREKWSLTSYEPGLFVEGVSLPHVLSLAVVEAAKLRCST